MFQYLENSISNCISICSRSTLVLSLRGFTGVCVATGFASLILQSWRQWLSLIRSYQKLGRELFSPQAERKGRTLACEKQIPEDWERGAKLDILWFVLMAPISQYIGTERKGQVGTRNQR